MRTEASMDTIWISGKKIRFRHKAVPEPYRLQGEPIENCRGGGPLKRAGYTTARAL